MLPARVSDYTPDQLDTLTATGRYVWLRLKLSGSGRSPVRTTPITIVRRAELAMWQDRDHRLEVAEGLSAKARHLMNLMQERGARFFSDLVRDSGMLRTEVENALSELVAAGIAFADSYAGLRALVTPLARRRRSGRVTSSMDPLDAGGRWDLVPPPETAEQPEERLEAVARTLLARYGVVFRRLLERETGLPPWRDLLRAYWRLEARGEVRGGRFVESFSGEQFAHPEAVEPLRRQRDTADRESLVVVCGADPVNLAGIVTPGERIPATPGNRVLFRDGVPVAAQTGKDFRNLVPLRTSDEWLYRQLLTKRFAPPGRKRHNQRRSSA
jgi:ATP-dependent Lhr-like helicase